MKLTTLYSLIGILFLLLSIPVNAGMIDKDGMQEWEICAMCHSYDGISRMPKFPKLAGQKAAYISQQFYDFKEGHRTNDGGQMVAITTEVDPSKVNEIANYFSQLPLPQAEVLSEDLDDLLLFNAGEKLFTQGRSGVPNCISCHGHAKSSAPWLYAQHKAYIGKQLRDFRSADRGGKSQSEMLGISSQLTDSEIESVAFYLAATQPRLFKN